MSRASELHVIAGTVARMLRVKSPTVRKGTVSRRALANARASDTIALRDTYAVWEKDSLARNFRKVVEDFIHRLKAEIRHADRVGVWIAKRDAQLRASL